MVMRGVTGGWVSLPSPPRTLWLKGNQIKAPFARLVSLPRPAQNGSAKGLNLTFLAQQEAGSQSGVPVRSCRTEWTLNNGKLLLHMIIMRLGAPLSCKHLIKCYRKRSLLILCWQNGAQNGMFQNQDSQQSPNPSNQGAINSIRILLHLAPERTKNSCKRATNLLAGANSVFAHTPHDLPRSNRTIDVTKHGSNPPPPTWQGSR